MRVDGKWDVVGQRIQMSLVYDKKPEPAGHNTYTLTPEMEKVTKVVTSTLITILFVLYGFNISTICSSAAMLFGIITICKKDDNILTTFEDFPFYKDRNATNKVFTAVIKKNPATSSSPSAPIKTSIIKGNIRVDFPSHITMGPFTSPMHKRRQTLSTKGCYNSSPKREYPTILDKINRSGSPEKITPSMMGQIDTKVNSVFKWVSQTKYHNPSSADCGSAERSLSPFDEKQNTLLNAVRATKGYCRRQQKKIEKNKGYADTIASAHRALKLLDGQLNSVTKKL